MQTRCLKLVTLSPAVKVQEERTLHETKLAKMEAEMDLVFQQKVDVGIVGYSMFWKYNVSPSSLLRKLLLILISNF